MDLELDGTCSRHSKFYFALLSKCSVRRIRAWFEKMKEIGEGFRRVPIFEVNTTAKRLISDVNAIIDSCIVCRAVRTIFLICMVLLSIIAHEKNCLNRSQIQHLGLRPFTGWLIERRAQNLFAAFPHYDESMLQNFVETDAMAKWQQ